MEDQIARFVSFSHTRGVYKQMKLDIKNKFLVLCHWRGWGGGNTSKTAKNVDPGSDSTESVHVVRVYQQSDLYLYFHTKKNNNNIK